MVQPLTRAQVITYLSAFGSVGKRIKEALSQDRSLQEFLDSPLLLNVVTSAYVGQSTAPLAVSGTVSDRRQRLFEAYVHQMLVDRPASRPYTLEDTVHWLGWLAHQLTVRGLTVFHLEQLQPNWLSESRQHQIRWLYSMISGLTVGAATFAAIFGMWSDFDIAVRQRVMEGLAPAMAIALGICVVEATSFRHGDSELASPARMRPRRYFTD